MVLKHANNVSQERYRTVLYFFLICYGKWFKMARVLRVMACTYTGVGS